MTGIQARLFLSHLGDEWLDRNRSTMAQEDTVSDLVEELGITPTAVLELGCCTGWRLKKMRAKYKCAILGIDPSQKAIAEAGEPANFIVGTADNLSMVGERACDMVIFGYCLWGTDIEDWFKIVAESDRVLRPHGYIIIHDYAVARPFRRRYYGTYTSHFDWPTLWTANPGYRMILERYIAHKSVCTSVLQKDYDNAIPVAHEEADNDE